MATTNTITFNGLTIGSGTVYGIVEFEGMDSLTLSPASFNVSHVDGGVPITQHLHPRTLRFSVRVPDSGKAAFEAAFTRTELEMDMDVVWDGMPNLLVICKLSNRTHVRTRESEFEPRRLYIVEMNSATGVLRGTHRNVVLTHATNSAALTQLGNALSYPTIVMTGNSGTVQTPISFTNVTTGEVLELSAAADLFITSGQSLITDHKPLQRTALYNGVSSYKEVTVSSVFWGISSGDVIRYDAIYDVGAPTVTVFWYDFYI